MKEFKDKDGKSWTVDITVQTVKRVRDLCDGIDLLSLATPGNNLMPRLEDPCTLVGVLYAVCLPQIQERSLSPEAFGGSFTGDALEDAANALTTDIIDFFPNRKRQVLHTAFRRVQTVGEERIRVEVNQALQQIESPEFTQAVEQAFDRISGK